MSDRRRIAIYIRVSTQEQSTELQLGEITQYATARGWAKPAVYEDKATGTNAKRPMLQKMLRDARERKIDLVVCWKLDRLFRSLKDLIQTLQEFSELGVEFISLKDNIDLTTSSGRLLMHLLGAFAEFEASLIRERVRAGVANARAKGRRLGRPKQRDDQAIANLRAKGATYRQIATNLGVSVGSVQRSFAVSKSQNGAGSNW